MLREEKESYKLQATSYKERAEATKKQGTRFKKILLNLAPLFLVSCSLQPRCSYHLLNLMPNA